MCAATGYRQRFECPTGNATEGAASVFVYGPCVRRWISPDALLLGAALVVLCLLSGWGVVERKQKMSRDTNARIRRQMRHASV